MKIIYFELELGQIAIGNFNNMFIDLLIESSFHLPCENHLVNK